MKTWFLLLMVITSLSWGFTEIAMAQTGPEFRLGFLNLASQISDVVGQPLENEHWGTNGDSLQQTTNGLMAWRKAYNWTAFTNGSRTWVNGSYGVMERANEERFEWERDLGSPSPAAQQPSPTVAVTPAPAPAQQPTVADKAAQIKGHLIAAVMAYGNNVFPGGKAASQNLYPLGNPPSRFLVKMYLEGIVKSARDDDTLALYLLWMAPALDIAPNVHVWLLQDRFLDRFSRSMAETGVPPLQVLSVLTPAERSTYDYLKRDGDFSANGARNCSPYLYASLR